MVRLFRLWRLAGRDLGLLWYALQHPARPIWLLPAVAVLSVFALDPANFAIPALGAVDDLLLLPLLLHGVVKLLPAQIQDGFARRALQR